MARRILRFLVLLLFGGAGLAIFKRTSAKRGRTDSRLRAAATPVAISANSEATASPKATSASPNPKRRSNGWSPKLPVRRVLWITGVLLLAGAVTFALFTQTSANNGNTYASAADFRAPTVDRSVIQPNGGNNGSAGYVKQGQSYFVYANVTDTGNPASGISTVTGNVCNVTSTSCSSVAMTAGSYTVNSITYNYRSAALTASNPLSEGSKSYSITAADVASNSGNTSFSVTVDNTGPTVTRQIACGGSGCITTDYVGAGKTYYVYAQVSDAASGINTVSANLAVASNVITTGATSVSLTTSGGPWTIGGNTYNYRSAQQTADAGLVNASTKNWNLTATDNVTNSTNPSDTATVDNVAPTATSLALDKNFGRFRNYIKASGSYFLYTDASDAASGVDTENVSANAAVDAPNTLSTGQTSVEMCYSGSGYSLPAYHSTTNEVYDFKSEADGVCDASFTTLTTDAGIPNGARNWQVTVADNAGNTATASTAANIDNTANTASDVKIHNTSGGTVGRLEPNDTVIFNFSSSTDPDSVMTGWDGSNDSTGNVVTRLTDGGGSCVASSDQLQVYNATNTTPTDLGTVCLGGTGYNTSGSTITFGATGTPSTLEAGFTNPLALTLGTQSAAAATQATNTTTSWTPTNSLFDLAGNTVLTTTATNTIDNTAPTISATRLCGGSRCSADWVGQGKTYFVYANASDATAGIDPPSGVKADVSNITTGASAVALPTCSSNCTVNGTTYTYKSAQQTANGTLTGTKAWTLTVKDNVSNQASTTPSATVDNTAPTVASTTIAKSTGTGLYLAGKVKASGTYYVYANVTDANSGVDTVTANVNNVTTGQTTVAMTAGSFSVNGTAYSYRSAALTANAGLTNGSTPTYSITGTDNAVNVTTLATPTVTVDNTAPTANTTTKVAATNQTGTVSKPDVGDRIVYTYSEQIDPESILAGWTGASTNITVRLNNNTACPSSANANDNVTIFNTTNATQANIGCVDLLTTAYVTANVTFGQTGSTTLSTMSQSGNAITVTLGSTTGTTVTTAGTRNMIWWPSASAFDAAGNAETTTQQAETDNDTDF
jgi:hypothetical protein